MSSAMSPGNVTLTVLAWVAFATHLAVGVIAHWHRRDVPLVPLVNLVTALCVLAYWSHRWYGYLASGIAWYAIDQLVPLYAIVVCVLAALALAGRYQSTVPNWVVFGIDTTVLVGAALFFTLFRINRLF